MHDDLKPSRVMRPNSEGFFDVECESDAACIPAPWPTSAFRRPFPGTAVIGRRWETVRLSDLPGIVGEVLKDASTWSSTARFEVWTEMRDGECYATAEVLLVSDVSIELNAISSAVLTENLERRTRRLGNQHLSLTFHSEGWYWTDMALG